jgi:hypothetical protein
LTSTKDELDNEHIKEECSSGEEEMPEEEAQA